jgi:hypothetical protein
MLRCTKCNDRKSAIAGASRTSIAADQCRCVSRGNTTIPPSTPLADTELLFSTWDRGGSIARPAPRPFRAIFRNIGRRQGVEALAATEKRAFRYGLLLHCNA